LAARAAPRRPLAPRAAPRRPRRGGGASKSSVSTIASKFKTQLGAL
jgi:hypothetical protein